MLIKQSNVMENDHCVTVLVFGKWGHNQVICENYTCNVAYKSVIEIKKTNCEVLLNRYFMFRTSGSGDCINIKTCPLSHYIQGWEQFGTAQLRGESYDYLSVRFEQDIP